MVRLSLVGAALIAVTYGLARFAVGLFVPELRAAFDLTSTAVGWVMAASFGGYLVSLALAGTAIDRFGARAVALVSGVCAVLGTSGIALAKSPPVLIVAAGLGGLSTGWASTALATAVQLHIEPRQQSLAQTTINAGTSLGLIVAAPVAVLAAAAWQLAWLAFAGLAVAAALAVAATLAREPVIRREPATDRPIVATRGGRRVPPTLAAAAALLGVSSAGFWGFGRELLETTFALAPDESRMAWVAVGIGGLAGVGAGFVSDRFGLRPALAIGWLAFAAAHAGLTVRGAGFVTAIGLVALFGAAYMALTGLLIVWSVQERPEQPGAAVGAAFLVLAAGQIVGSPLAGRMIDTVGFGAAFLFAAAVAALGLAARPANRRVPTTAEGTP